MVEWKHILRSLVWFHLRLPPCFREDGIHYVCGTRLLDDGEFEIWEKTQTTAGYSWEYPFGRRTGAGYFTPRISTFSWPDVVGAWLGSPRERPSGARLYSEHQIGQYAHGGETHYSRLWSGKNARSHTQRTQKMQSLYFFISETCDVYSTDWTEKITFAQPPSGKEWVLHGRISPP